MATARRNVSIFINGREVENSIKGITAEKRKLTRELNRMTVGSEEYNKTVKQISGLNTTLTKHRKDLRGIESGWDSVTGGAKKFLSATNIAAIAGMAGITLAADAAVDAIVDTVQEVTQLRREITQLTGTSGDELDEITVKVRALGKTFEVDTNEALRASNALVKEFGIEYSEALDLIAEGNLKGANASGDFLDNIREYSVQFAEAGFSAEEFLQLSVRAQQEGIFSDKGLDAVKEFGLRIREQTPAVIDALDGAFGQGFTDRITKGINEGKITTADALKDIAKQINETEIPANKLQTVLADVFAGPGEDAGIRFIQILQDAQDELITTGTDAQILVDAQRELLLANQDLATAENALAVATFALDNGFNIFFTRLKTIGLTLLADTAEFFQELPATINGVRAALGELSATDIITSGSPIARLFKSIFGDETSGERTKKIGKAYREGYLKGLEPIKTQQEAAKALQLDKANEEQEKRAEQIAQRRADRTRKEAERELAALEKKLQKINETIDKYQQERLIANLSEEEQRLEKIRQRYAKEIAETEKLEASKNEQISLAATEQKKELLRLQSEELEAEREKISEEETTSLLDRLTAQNEAELEHEAELRQQRADIEAELKEFTDEALLAEEEIALERLEAQGERLLELARSQGISTVELEKAIAAEKAKIDDQAKEKELQKEEEHLKAKQALQGAALGLARDLATGLAAVAGENETLQKAVFAFNKAIAAAEVIINLQKEVAIINATYGALPPLAATLTTIARVRAGISLATIAATAVQQKKLGGWANVRGADDNQPYTARLIGQPDTGLLNYPHPVLTASGILANEVGREYYVSHSDLRNPAVLNHVRAIDNITSHRQRQEGGFAPTNPAQNVTTTAPPPANQELKTVLEINAQLLTMLIQQGVRVQWTDNDAIALSKHLDRLNTASGGRAFE